jgi:hypothetical protein
MRCTVPVPIPSDLATFNIPTPFASCFRTLRSVALSIFGRPNDPGRSAARSQLISESGFTGLFGALKRGVALPALAFAPLVKLLAQQEEPVE